MIRRPSDTAAKPADSAEGADDLEILHPERELEVAGVKVVVREYGGVEGMRLAALAAPVVGELSSLSNADNGGDLLAYINLQAVFAKHVDAVTAMVAQACDQPVEWVRGIERDEDMQALVMTWWAVNGPFFVRRVVQALQMRVALGAFGGQTSTPPSPPPGTPKNASEGTRAVN